LDNAAAHKSVQTGQTLNLLDIARLAWPPQSPDLNAIEHCWDYIRAQIKKRKHVPRTEEEVITAWEEEWQNIPVSEINKWIENLEKQLRKVVDHNGDNCFHA
jgi:transposase